MKKKRYAKIECEEYPDGVFLELPPLDAPFNTVGRNVTYQQARVMEKNIQEWISSEVLENDKEIKISVMYLSDKEFDEIPEL